MNAPQAAANLQPESMVDEFKKIGITHVVTIPDSETNHLYELMCKQDWLEIVPCAREGECFAIAFGLMVGKKVPVILIQNTGLLESGNAIRTYAMDTGWPMLMIVGYRGWDRYGETKDSAARYTEPFLDAFRIDYFLVENNADAPRISQAWEKAKRTNRPVAVLIGDEFHGFNNK